MSENAGENARGKFCRSALDTAGIGAIMPHIGFASVPGSSHSADPERNGEFRRAITSYQQCRTRFALREDGHANRDHMPVWSRDIDSG